MRKLIIPVVCAALVAMSSALLAQGGSIRLVPQPPQGVKFAATLAAGRQPVATQESSAP